MYVCVYMHIHVNIQNVWRAPCIPWPLTKRESPAERVKMKLRIIQGVVGRTEYFQWSLVVHLFKHMVQ